MKKSLFVTVLLFLACNFLFTISTYAATIQLPATGQAVCYDVSGNIIDCAGTGEDGAIRAGVAWPNPRFMDNNNGTVTDKLTGLVWAANANSGGKLTWQLALDYVNGLNNTRYLGFNDWRLPNISELSSLVDRSKVMPSVPDNSFFINVQSDTYWSSTTMSSYTLYAAVVGMQSGYIGNYDKYNQSYVWPVRAGIYTSTDASYALLPKTGQSISYSPGDDGALQIGVTWPSPRFETSASNQGVIIDKLTGLEWSADIDTPTVDICEGGLHTWAGALGYVACLNTKNYLGYSDWRLPNINELQSLVDRGSDGYYGYAFWTSTSTPIGGYAWYVDFNSGETLGHLKDDLWTGFGVWPVRGGQGGTLDVIGLSPTVSAFPSLYPNETASKTFTIINGLSANANIAGASITGTNAADFSLSDGCSGTTLASKASCTFSVNFTPLSCGTQSATLNVTTDQGNLTAVLSGSSCGVGTATIGGIVRDATTKLPVSGVSVTVGSNGSYTTDTSGRYLAENIIGGALSLVAAKSGYETARANVTLAPLQSAQKDISLPPATIGFRVTAVTSKYSSGKPYYFLPGVSFNVDFTADINWNGKTPSKVRFVTSKGSYDVATSGSSATKTINVGSEFDACGVLQVIAIAADGSQTAAKNADFMVTQNMYDLFANPYTVVNGIDGGFTYKNTLASFSFIDQVVDADLTNANPLFNKITGYLSYAPDVSFEFNSSGDGKYSFKWDDLEAGKFLEKKWQKDRSLKTVTKVLNDYFSKGVFKRSRFPRLGAYGQEFAFFPIVDIKMNFLENACGSNSSAWDYSGTFGLAAEGGWSYSRQLLTPPLPPAIPPIPYYFKGKFEISVDGSVNITDAISKKQFNGELNIAPKLTGTAGLGVNEVFGLEGTGSGTLIWKPHWNEDDTIKLLSEFSIRVFALMFQKEWLWPVGEWCVRGCDTTEQSVSSVSRLLQGPEIMIPIPRTYLKAAVPADFKAAPSYTVKQVATDTQSYSVASAPIVTSTFPVSSASLSSNGSNVNLVWLKDNTARTLMNRTMLQHSSFDGSTWSTPVAVADNGTADFNPSSLTFSDGSMVAAWEDMKTTLPDTALLEDVVPLMEIAAAVYNPTTKTWGTAVRLTNNGSLERTPKLAGKDKNNLLLTWIANSQNDLVGSATKPNSMYAATFNGTAWSTPQLLASIPNAIKRYSAVYDGTTANIVLSLDTDANSSTLEDLELYRLTNNGGTWGSLTRLTNDAIIDDNPQLALDSSNNVVMTWVKGNELSSVVNFDFANRTVIRAEDNYSSTLADYKQAQATDGKVAVIYADNSEDSTSDLFGLFYDPVFKVWGEPKQLTFDAETEQWPSIAFLGTDTIISVYNRKLLINPDGTPTTGALTDLYMLKHTMGDDLALESGSLISDPRNPAPGTAVTLSAVAQNLGDKVAQNIPVTFYNGDPANGGTSIGTATIAGPFKPGEVQTVSVSWTIPAGAAPYTVYAVIDPNATIDTLNRANNVISSSLAQPDLSIRNITWEKLAATKYSMIVTVANIGGTASAASTVTLHNGSSTGPVITNLTVPTLARFASVDLAYTWDASATVQPYYTVVATVDEANSIAESDELNNSYTVVLGGNLQDISVTPNPLSGTANIGQTSAALLTIRNAGTAPLNVTGITKSGTDAAAFTLAPSGDNACTSLTPTIQAGLSCTVGISITPTALVTKTATVTVASNDPDTPSVAVPVTVTGVDSGAPVISAFVIPATVKTKTIPFTTLTATDNVAITGWMVTETSTPPVAGSAGWLATKPTGYAVTTNGSKTIYIWAKDAAVNVSAPMQATTSVQIPNLTLSVSGPGSVSSFPAGISCSSGTCSSLFDDSTGVTLTALPGTLATFTGWGGACTNLSGTCALSMTADKTVTATFNLAPKAKIGSAGYGSFADAYAAAGNNAVIMLLEDYLTLSTTINKPLTLQGGFMADYIRSTSGYTILQGVLTIGTGSVNADRIVVK